MKILATLAFTSGSLAVAAAVAVATAAEPASLVRRGNKNHRRHLLESDDECVLYRKDIQYENHTGEEMWSCEFPKEVAQKFGGQDIMDIRGVSFETFESLGAVSGESVLKTKGAFVEQFIGKNSAATRLVFPDDDDESSSSSSSSSSFTRIQIERMHETDPRHQGQRRRKRQRQRQRRNLASSQPGTLRTLVVRVIDGSGIEPSPDAAKLRDDIFEDSVSLKTQYAACSKDQLIIEPADDVGDNGIVSVTIDANAQIDSNFIGNYDVLERQAKSKAETLYGGNLGLENEYDLVMFCMPPGSGSWVAYAYINRWDSFYNSHWCSSVSAQMHEIGHNLNLAHSGEVGNEYADESGMMGYSYNWDDGPRKCFNAVKNYQLGWYDRQKESIYPLDYVGIPQAFVFNGIDDYKKKGSTDNKLVTLRLKQYGGSFGVDYYVGYNRATGANSGVNEAKDTVTIYEKALGGPNGYGGSTRVAALVAGENYRIQNFKGSNTDVYIYVHSFSNDLTDATVIVSAGELVTVLPTDADNTGCDDDLDWKYRGEKGKKCTWVGEGNNWKIKKKCTKMDGDRHVYEICPETCGRVGVGSCVDEKHKNSGCSDDPDFRYNNDPSKMCLNWVVQSKNKRVLKKRCQKSVGDGTRVFDHCKDTCGVAGLGSCSGGLVGR